MVALCAKPALIGVVVIALLYLLHRRLTNQPNLPDVPWVNHEPGQWFGKQRARLRTTLDYRSAIHTAYQNYSKRSECCILASMGEEFILLPAKTINWIINQPDSVLSSFDVVKMQLQVDHTFPLPQIIHNPSHHDTIKRELTRQVGNLTGEIMDELSASFDDVWGTDPSHWKEVCIFETVMRIVARTSNRVFVGLPLCRNVSLLNNATGFAQDVPLSSMVLRQIPPDLRPIFRKLITYPNRKHSKAFAKLIKPEIARRQTLDEKSKPNDFLQWTLDRAASSHLASESDPDIVSSRLLAVNFAAIHTSTFSATNTIFDLVSVSPSILDELRSEAISALASTDGVWCKQTISLMTKHDSCLRESSRLGSLLSVGLPRQVMVPAGITAPNGTHCPFGSWVAVPSHGVHNDPAIYDDVAEFKPFRFSDQRQSLRHQAEDGPTDEYTKQANLSFVSMSPTYHPFGHGRHACPGRFFASNELKLLLAYMVMNYDFEMEGGRPQNKWIGTTIIPPLKETLRVRRRKA